MICLRVSEISFVISTAGGFEERSCAIIFIVWSLLLDVDVCVFVVGVWYWLFVCNGCLSLGLAGV